MALNVEGQDWDSIAKQLKAGSVIEYRTEAGGILRGRVSRIGTDRFGWIRVNNELPEGGPHSANRIDRTPRPDNGRYEILSILGADEVGDAKFSFDFSGK